MAIQKIRLRKGVIFQGKTDKWARVLAPDAVLYVPQDIDKETAKAWVDAGLAIEDKLGPGAAETK
jgi:hypothetical protein